MGVFEGLHKAMEETEANSTYRGYWYRIRDILSIMVCGMLC